MIPFPPKELRELAGFWSSEGDAISFYFQPDGAKGATHRDGKVLTKEQIQETFGRLRADSPSARRDVERLLAVVAARKGDDRDRGRVIFACARHGLWRDYDCGGVDLGAHFDAGNSFTLAPLVPALQSHGRICIALADRHRGRLLLCEAEQISEHGEVLGEEEKIPGPDASGRLERHGDKQARPHFRFLADHLLRGYEHKDFELLLIGCRDEMWGEIHEALNGELERILMGHFRADAGLLADAELAGGLAARMEVLERAWPLIEEREKKDEEQRIEAAVGEASRGGLGNASLGNAGLGEVVQSLERGEVRTLLWSRHGAAEATSASACSQCGHIMLGWSERCDLCGGLPHFFEEAREALFRRALATDVEMRVIRYAALPPGREVLAELRFRAERRQPQALAS